MADTFRQLARRAETERHTGTLESQICYNLQGSIAANPLTGERPYFGGSACIGSRHLLHRILYLFFFVGCRIGDLYKFFTLNSYRFFCSTVLP